MNVEKVCPVCLGVQTIFYCPRCDDTGKVTERIDPLSTPELRREWLERHNTRELLYLRKSCYRNGYYSPWDSGYGVTLEDIKEVLATREHIPNKLEGRKLRQEAAKKNRGGRKSRGRG